MDAVAAGLNVRSADVIPASVSRVGVTVGWTRVRVLARLARAVAADNAGRPAVGWAAGDVLPAFALEVPANRICRRAIVWTGLGILADARIASEVPADRRWDAVRGAVVRVLTLLAGLVSAGLLGVGGGSDQK